MLQLKRPAVYRVGLAGERSRREANQKGVKKPKNLLRKMQGLWLQQDGVQANEHDLDGNK